AVPVALSRLIMKLLAKAPEQRPGSAAEVADALAALEEGHRPRSPRWPWIAAGVLLLAVLGPLGWLFGPMIHRIVTNKGELVIQVDDPNVEVIVKQNGEQVAIVDRKTGRRVDLTAGEYTLELAGGPEGLKLSADRFVLRRGETALVSVARLPPGTTVR